MSEIPYDKHGNEIRVGDSLRSGEDWCFVVVEPMRMSEARGRCYSGDVTNEIVFYPAECEIVERLGKPFDSKAERPEERAAGAWVAAAERLPDLPRDGQPTWYSEERCVLATDGDRVGLAFYDPKKLAWFEDTTRGEEPADSWDVTHWAEIRKVET